MRFSGIGISWSRVKSCLLYSYTVILGNFGSASYCAILEAPWGVQHAIFLFQKYTHAVDVTWVFPNRQQLIGPVLSILAYTFTVAVDLFSSHTTFIPVPSRCEVYYQTRLDWMKRHLPFRRSRLPGVTQRKLEYWYKDVREGALVWDFSTWSSLGARLIEF
jgi:hypothetical protein